MLEIKLFIMFPSTNKSIFLPPFHFFIISWDKLLVFPNSVPLFNCLHWQAQDTRGSPPQDLVLTYTKAYSILSMKVCFGTEIRRSERKMVGWEICSPGSICRRYLFARKGVTGQIILGSCGLEDNRCLTNPYLKKKKTQKLLCPLNLPRIP